MKALTLMAAIALAGCAGSVANPVKTTTPFNEDEVAFINQSGPGAITGQAFLRQRGGGVVTCAGQEVALVPSGGYARERIGNAFGTISETAGGRAQNILDAPDPAYVAAMRRTVCDAQGNFVFQGVADGEYFVTTTVVWTVGYTPQGGPMMSPVSIRGGNAVDLIISL